MKRRVFLRWTVFVLLTALILCGMSACSFLNFDVGSNSNKKKTNDEGIKVVLHNIEGYEISDFINQKDHTLIKPSSDPVREGYDFVMWCSDEACTTELAYGTKLTSDLDIYPAWTVKRLTVTFVNTMDNSRQTATVDYDTTVTCPTAQAAGYEFDGWYTAEEDGEKFDARTKIKADLTLYSGWNVVRYELTYVTNGGTLSEDAPTSYTMFSTTTLPGCRKDGFTFAGWYENSNFSGMAVPEIPKGRQGEKTLFAKFVCNLAEVSAKHGFVTVTGDRIEFSVKYRQTTINLNNYLDFSDGATYKVYSGAEEVAISLPDNTGDENITYPYTLKVTSESGETEKEYELVITQFTDKYITVTYYVNGVAVSSDPERQAGDKASTIEDPTPEAGYRFDYWCVGSVDGEEYDFDSMLDGTQDLDLYAVFTPIEFSISYVLGYGENDANNPTTYTVEDEVALGDAVSLNEEYVFDGWYNSTYTVRYDGIARGTVDDVTLYARYALINKTVKDFFGRESVTLEELSDYFVYAMYYRLSEISITVTGGQANEEIRPYVVNAFKKANYVDGAEGHGVQENFSLEADENGEWNLRFAGINYKNDPSLSSSGGTYEQVEPYKTHLSETGRDEDFNDFAIEHVTDSLVVDDTEQLVYAAEHGYRPLPSVGSEAEAVYSAAKTVLRTIIDNGMTDYEKVLAIYEYIIKNVYYDHDTFNRVISQEISDSDASNYYCFYLDGVFLNHVAVCDGYSKAFLLLARMEGIRAVQIEGTTVGEGSGHAWNKVFLSVNGGERAWYVIDCTHGDASVEFNNNGSIASKEVMTHACFLYTDAEKDIECIPTENEEFSSYEALTDGEYYANTTFTWHAVEYSFLIENDTQMAAFLSYLLSCVPDGIQISIDMKIDSSYDPFSEGGSLRQDIVNAVGSTISGYNISRTGVSDSGCCTFLAKKK